MKKAMIAMSGGVDSSVAAYLLQKEEYSVCGGTLHLTGEVQPDARLAAERLGLPFYEFDEREAFLSAVISDFAESYERGETPNPCIVCNEKIKFGLLLRHARRLGCDFLATGHYARLQKDAGSGRTLLLRGKDRNKDQSYMLYRLNQEQLSHSLFPLGDLSKPEVREIAESIGLSNANKPDSQDICFVPDGDYAAVLEALRGSNYPAGDFVDENGTVLGRHQGVIRYTVGQRKGLGIALGAPAFVLAKDAAQNRVILGPEERLFVSRVWAKNVNWIACDAPSDGMSVTVKTRYTTRESAARLHLTETGVVAEFTEPQRAPAPGQAMVFYADEVVVGGGTITGGE
ncbi:MAG: tRNA 2-thiouridine(34) synthase MnmA [Ruminococcaceae bacterium]|nr:tRNA 2-thiouridine(34) synthase MnmA [Oscillospiraceae bacterium]